MAAVTVSSKFQIVIPRSVRERLGIVPGEKLEVVAFDGRIELVRMPKKSLRGFLKGLDPEFKRDEEDRV